MRTLAEVVGVLQRPGFACMETPSQRHFPCGNHASIQWRFYSQVSGSDLGNVVVASAGSEAPTLSEVAVALRKAAGV